MPPINRTMRARVTRTRLYQRPWKVEQLGTACIILFAAVVVFCIYTSVTSSKIGILRSDWSTI